MDVAKASMVRRKKTTMGNQTPCRTRVGTRHGTPRMERKQIQEQDEAWIDAYWPPAAAAWTCFQ